MRLPPLRHSRPATSVVEVAILFPLVFLLILGRFVGGVGIYRYQEVAHLAREGARYASTHGGQYQRDKMPQTTGVPAVSSTADLVNYLSSKTVLLDASQTQVNVNRSAPSSVTPSNFPTYADSDPNLVPPGQSIIQNYVTVTVTYNWMPELYLVGPLTLTSTSKMPMSY